MDTKKKKKCLGHIGTVLTYIILGFAVIAALFPLAWVASTSIKPGNEVFSNPPYWIPKMPTLSNYLLVLTESSIPRAFLNSTIVGGMSTVIALLLGGSAGYAFARFKFRGSKGLSLFDDSDVLYGKCSGTGRYKIGTCDRTFGNQYAVGYMDGKRIL